VAEFVKVARREDLEPGRGMLAIVNGTRVALFNCDGTIYAIKGTCPHMGGELWEGPIQDGIVSCPWHGWRFDVRTGKSPDAEVVTVGSYEVRIDGEDIYVGA